MNIDCFAGGGGASTGLEQAGIKIDMLAQGFPSDYIIDRDYTGAKYPVKEQVARIGNSVVPVMARVIAEANLKEG